MATTLTNSLEGISNGTTPTNANSGGTSGTAFDTAELSGPPSGGTLASDNTHAAHGSQALEIATAATAGTCYAGWSTSMGTLTTAWFRVYLYITANPANVLRLFSALAGSTAAASIALTTGGLLRQLNGSTQTTVQTGAVAIPANQWVRIEGFFTGSATVGQIEHKLFKTLDSTTPDETLTSAANLNTTGSLTQYRYGNATSLASVGPYWMDDFGLSDTAYLGPANTAVPRPVSALQAVSRAANY